MPEPTLRGTRQLALEVAESIGRRLVNEAFWAGECCTWLAAESVDYRMRRRSDTYRAVDRWLYDGSAGIAVFLAALATATGDAKARRTACGAIAHALRDAEGAAPPHRLGLYSGWSGVAVACLLVGHSLRQDALLDQASRVARRSLVPYAARGQEFDLIGGHAGDLLAALGLLRRLGDPLLLDAALRLGQRLADTAQIEKGQASWATPTAAGNRHLLGLSHGTAGAALALLELWSQVRDDSLRELAHAALAYEARWFSPAQQNWPDLRDVAARRNPRTPRYSVFWCHGAPGVALARMRAHELLADAASASDASAALSTTRREIQAYLQAGTGNFSLCHGLAGLGDVLLSAQRFGHAQAEDAQQLTAIVRTAHANHASTGESWPCGTHGGETPGAMLGLAGIGHFHLSVADLSQQSLLLPLVPAAQISIPASV